MTNEAITNFGSDHERSAGTSKRQWHRSHHGKPRLSCSRRRSDGTQRQGLRGSAERSNGCHGTASDGHHRPGCEASELLSPHRCTHPRLWSQLPFTRNGKTGRRTVDVVDVTDYQRQERERMQASLSAMRQAAQEIAMDDDETASYVAQFD